MRKLNMDFREAAEAQNLYLWQIAREAGVSPGTLNNWLREPLPTEKRDRLMAAIHRLCAAREAVSA